ncbi:MAG TPA: hypothetical protein VFU68_02475, partial [Terracidiphilus sp.]|nr:hypothetical protein [Terracidiphilus sp.]
MSLVSESAGRAAGAMRWLTRREALRGLLAASCGLAVGCGGSSASTGRNPQQGGGPPVGIPMPTTQAEFLDLMIKAGCLYFWEQASATTGQVLDRARN